MATTRSRKGRPSLYIRVSVPRSLRAIVGRSEIVKSLDTNNSSIGNLRAGLVSGKAARLFLFIQQRGHTMTKAEIRALVSRYIEERLDDWEENTYEPAVQESLRKGNLPDEEGGTEWQDIHALFSQSTAEDCEKALRSNDLGAIAPILEEFVAKYKLKIKPETPEHRTLARELLKAEAVIARKMRERVQGMFGEDYQGSGSALAGPSLSLETEESSPLLSAVAPLYLKHFEHRAPGTIEAKRSVLKRFGDLIGDKPLHTITKQEGITYRDLLGKLPANASKKFPGVPLLEVLQRAEVMSKLERLSKQTINKDLTHLQHFFSWSIKEEKYKGSNPIDGLAFEGLEYKASETFTDEDIKTVFGSEEFQKQKHDVLYSSRYWLPLILLHTGARREEIANLGLSDIRQEEGVWFFDIAPDQERGRRLKNKASKRKVPVHSHLIALGFLGYVEERRTKGAALLFSKKSTSKGRATAGDSVSKWFHRLLKKLNVKGSKSLHGLRPTVTTKLHEAGVDGETRRELLGHSGKDVHESVYLRLSLRTLSENLEKLKYTAPRSRHDGFF